MLARERQKKHVGLHVGLQVEAREGLAVRDFCTVGELRIEYPSKVSTRRSKGCWKFFSMTGCSDGGCGSREALRRL